MGGRKSIYNSIKSHFARCNSKCLLSYPSREASALLFKIQFPFKFLFRYSIFKVQNLNTLLYLFPEFLGHDFLNSQHYLCRRACDLQGLAPINIHLCIRHGFGPNTGWLFLLLFPLIRLAGASENLATITFPTNIPLQTSPALLSTVGLSPLLFTTLGLLIRVNRGIKKTYPTHIKTNHIRLLRIPIIAALGLAVVGGLASANDFAKHGIYPISIFSKIAIPILIVIFAAVVMLTTWLVYHRRYAEAGEQGLALAIAASLLFLLIRLVYVTLVTFRDDGTFNVLDGSIVAFGCMAVLQEMIVTVIYIAVGLTLPKFEKETKGKSGESKLTRARRRFARGGERISKGWARLTGSTHRSEDHKQYEDEIVSLEWGYNGKPGKQLQ